MTMIKFEKVLTKENPDWVVVVGDVNATLACSIVAKKLNIKVCHIEAGLRSEDKTMPEEINRLVTDRLSDLLLTPDRISSENLIKEGISSSKIKFVGNIMIDTLENNIEKIGHISSIAAIEFFLLANLRKSILVIVSPLITKNDFSLIIFPAFLIAPPVPRGDFSIENLILIPNFFIFK